MKIECAIFVPILSRSLALKPVYRCMSMVSRINRIKTRRRKKEDRYEKSNSMWDSSTIDNDNIDEKITITYSIAFFSSLLFQNGQCCFSLRGR